MDKNQSKKIEKVDNVTVASGVLAELFGLTDRRVRQLAEEGIIKKVARGRYDLSESVRNYIVHLKTNNDLKEDKSEKEIDYDMEHALLERAKREKVELELAAMRGNMHHSQDVEKVMNDMLANFRAKILNLPSKAAPRLVLKEETSYIQDILQDEVLEALQELSNYDPLKFYSDKFIELDEDDENSVGDYSATTENKKENS